MARICKICGGVIFASNEVAGYSGPICNGMHQAYQYPNFVALDFHPRLADIERRLAQLEASAGAVQTRPLPNQSQIKTKTKELDNE